MTARISASCMVGSALNSAMVPSRALRLCTNCSDLRWSDLRYNTIQTIVEGDCARKEQEWDSDLH
jgi:hypothetical protein